MISLTEVVRIVTLSLPARQLSSGFARTQMSPKTKTPEIALAFNVGVPYLHRIAQGIREYADAHRPDWRFMLSAEMFNLTPASLKGWRGAGVIAHCDTRQDEQVVHGLGCPAVNISGVLAASRLPQVRSDNHAIGCLAATTLLRRGFQSEAPATRPTARPASVRPSMPQAVGAMSCAATVVSRAVRAGTATRTTSTDGYEPLRRRAP